MSGACPRLCLGPRLDMFICWRYLSPAFLVGTGWNLWSPLHPLPQSCPQSNGATLKTHVSERHLESSALTGQEGHIQGTMLSGESILADRISYFCQLCCPGSSGAFSGRWVSSLLCAGTTLPGFCEANPLSCLFFPAAIGEV